MTPVDIRAELTFKTARSGGKGGQNVNKVETMVEAYFNIAHSALLTPAQKLLVTEKLANRINAEGELLVKSQEERTQLANKHLVIKKMNELVNRALVVPKKRIPRKPSAAAKQKRLEQKKRDGQTKESRRKIRPE